VQQIKSCRRQLYRPKKLTLARLKYASAFAASGSADMSVASPARCFAGQARIDSSDRGRRAQSRSNISAATLSSPTVDKRHAA
jgi:hypothetical protein